MTPVNEMPHAEFSAKFMDAVEEFYDEWKEENDATLPDFENALDRAKQDGVLPSSEWIKGEV